MFKVEITYLTKRHLVVWCKRIAAPDMDCALNEAHRIVFRRHPGRKFIEALAVPLSDT